jgi:uncharacterized membrane protein YedE/YeeE
MPLVTALLAGLVFGLGLIVSGMADPTRGLGFLDLAGFVLAMLAGMGIFEWLERRARARKGMAQPPP